MIRTAPGTAPARASGQAADRIAALCASTAGTGRTILVSGGDDIRRRDPVTGAPIGPALTGHRGSVTALTVMPGDCSSPALVSGAGDGTVRVFDLETGTLIRTLTVPGLPPVRSITTLEDVHGRPLLAAAAGPVVQVWDPLTAEPLALLDGGSGSVTAVCPVWSGPTPTGRTVLASGTSEGTIRIWNTSTWRSIGELRGHNRAVRALCTVPSGPFGPLLVSAGDDGTVRLWHPLAVTTSILLTGHTGPVTALSTMTTPMGGRLVASGGADGTVRLWDPATTRAVDDPFTGGEGPITALCESPGSEGPSRLAIADSAGRVHLWAGPPPGE